MTDPVRIDEALVRELVSAQFPRWAHLPVSAVVPQGWDNRTFRLGAELSVRLPSGPGYADQVAKEQRWLPYLADRLSLPVPVPLAQGEPGAGYPFSWSVLRWLDGDPASAGGPGDAVPLAGDLAGFLRALQDVEPLGPPAGAHSAGRGGPLLTYDDWARRAVTALTDVVDVDSATAVWDTALAARRDGAPVWFHGDVAAGNLLVADGRLAAVIDFGCCGVGDPACDLTVAWTLFSGEAREVFRTSVALDEATWDRARGWALWKAAITVEEDRRKQHPLENPPLQVVRDVMTEWAERIAHRN